MSSKRGRAGARAKKPASILLGYEAGTGDPVYIRLHHVIATGATQLSGKTTTLEAIAARSELTIVAFKTKRGEANFSLPNVSDHAPYYHERADWQFVASLLESTTREKMKFERSWIINASKGASTLRDVLDNVTLDLTTARGLNASVLTTLQAYLELVVPEIEAIPFARELKLQPGLNVMDLVGLREEVQALVIASTLEKIHTEAEGTIVLIPEAWKFVPQGRGSPVKLPLERIVREGAAVDVYAFLDSQDVTGVEKAVLKNVDVWILGRQREMNEVQRTIDQLPVSKGKRPKAEEVMRLRVGHFIVASRDESGSDVVRTVYVKPTWLPTEIAVKIAKTGDVDAARLFAPERSADDQEEPDVSNERVRELEKDKRKLEAELRKLQEKLAAAAPPPPASAKRDAKKETPAAAPRAGGGENGGKKEVHLDVEVGVPSMTIRERVVTVTATSEDDRGRAALLIAEGFFDEPRQLADVIEEFRSRGWWNMTKLGGKDYSRMGDRLVELASMGFLRRDGVGKGHTYIVVDEAKDRIERVKETVRR